MSPRAERELSCRWILGLQTHENKGCGWDDEPHPTAEELATVA